MTRERLMRKYFGKRFLIGTSLFLAIAAVFFTGPTLAWLQSGPAPLIFADQCSFNGRKSILAIEGDFFRSGATVTVENAAGPVAHGRVKIKKAGKKIQIKKIAEAAVGRGVKVTVTNTDGTSAAADIFPAINDDSRLTAADVRTIISQAVAQAEASGLRAVIAVTDKEGNNLGTFTMANATPTTLVGIGTRCAGQLPNCGLEGVSVPSCAAAISKAVTGAFLSSQGHAFSTRTASFIVQEHFPPGVDFQPGGPLFGVQFSQLLCSDINPKAPLGLSADPGGIPLYKNGLQVGGLGVEGDGLYTLDPIPTDDDMPVEELVAVAGSRGYEAPAEIAGTISVNGIRFPYVNTPMPPALATTPFNRLRGTLVGACTPDPNNLRNLPLAPTQVRGVRPSEFILVNIDGVDLRVNLRLFPNFDPNNPRFNAGSRLTANEVLQMLLQGARQAFITRAAIRLPASVAAEVNISVVDTDGTLLGVVSTPDAPIFGFDVCVQKARTAAFFSNAAAGRLLRQGGFGRYVDAAAQDGLGLDGSVAFSDRAGGFLSRPFFPDGIDDTEHGPFSVPIEDFSPFNDGLQLDLMLDDYFVNIVRFLTTGDTAPLIDAVTFPCPSSTLASIGNGTQIFPGSVPIYKNGQLAGGLGVSGDGVDQDDLISAMGSAGFESAPEIRSDRVFVRSIRLPFVKFPRHPNR
ncbi:MAG: heme-binding protein [Blastocatellia bacterium]|nr:heme-binding protein [Blastocatellia bacterium]